MTKKQRALEVIERLKKEYPDAGCTLDYDQAWKLLVSVRLAAQCTDARVNVVVEGLYEKYPDVNALADADVDDIEEIVRPCGLGRSKARDISACMKMIRDEYGGKVPVSRIPTASAWSTGSGWWTASKSRKRWRWHFGRSSLRKREAISATVSFITAGTSVRQGQSRTVINAAWRISVKKSAWKNN